MKVILLKDIEDIGKKFEIKEVKDGYARNYLLPNGLAKPVTEEVLRWLEVQKEIESKKAEDELKKVQETVNKIDGAEVEIITKVGEKGQLFEKIDAKKIAEKVSEMGFKITKEQVALKEPIKELGEFPLKVKFDHNLEADIKLIITSEE
jgi:large subunit ribosomal protein L9